METYRGKMSQPYFERAACVSVKHTHTWVSFTLNKAENKRVKVRVVEDPFFHTTKQSSYSTFMLTILCTVVHGRSCHDCPYAECCMAQLGSGVMTAQWPDPGLLNTLLLLPSTVSLLAKCLLSLHCTSLFHEDKLQAMRPLISLFDSLNLVY